MKLFFLFILLTGLVFAVPSGSWIGVTSAATAPDFAMSAHPNMLTIPQGSAGKTIILLTSINGFQGNVTLSPPVSCLAIGCPQYTISPTVVKLAANQNTTAGFTIYTFSQTPLATYNVAVTGSSGSLSHSAPVTFTVVAPGNPDFTISANPSNQTVIAGNTGKSQTTLTSINSFNGTVKLTTSPPPLCASCPSWGISPSSVDLSPGGTATSILTFYTTTLSIFGGTQGGYGNVTVYGNSGSLSHSVIVSFKITPSPDFTITLSPSSQTVRKGSTTTFAIQVTGTNGFNNTVNLFATIAPVTRHGPAISLPSPVGPYSTSTLTVSTTRSTQPGTYTITVTATSGSLTHNSTVTVTVTS